MAEHRHVAMRVHAMWRRMGCMSVRTCVRMGVISGLSIHYRFLLTHYTRIDYILIKSSKFLSCETIYVCFYSLVTWRNLKQTIARFYRDC